MNLPNIAICARRLGRNGGNREETAGTAERPAFDQYAARMSTTNTSVEFAGMEPEAVLP
ncbi:hypothetical protein DSM100685_1444 [Bifidobacterium avesanii]|nr:hypothetical protein DSM100685_1444 [Bifidobacterium avesanii]